MPSKKGKRREIFTRRMYLRGGRRKLSKQEGRFWMSHDQRYNRRRGRYCFERRRKGTPVHAEHASNSGGAGGEGVGEGHEVEDGAQGMGGIEGEEVGGKGTLEGGIRHWHRRWQCGRD